MAKKIRIGLLGGGRIGKLHGTNLQNAVPDAEVVVLADPFLNDAMEDWAKSIGIPKCTKNADEVFADPDVDAVFICSSTNTHAEFIMKAAAAGKDIFCEKPIHTDIAKIKEALAKGLELCASVKPDLLLATDPDCDRVGIAVPGDNGEFVLFSGNEVGAMLLKYICQERTALGTMPKDPVAVKTIVSTDICKKIAAEYNVELREVLTGFKFIGEQIGFLEKKGEQDRYIFGFEESYGYLAGSYVRDKDAVVASMLICEMAAFYRTKGISLLKAREDLYAQYGNYLHSQKSFQCEGASGMERMKEIMTNLRTNVPTEIGGLKVLVFGDYMASEETELASGKKTVIDLPKSDVLAFRLEQGASVILRPSGTEPKIKAYYTTIGEKREDAQKLEEKIAEDFKAKLGF